MTDWPKPTAQVEVFVQVLGTEGAVAFLLEFGGSELYFARNPQDRSELVQLVGRDKAMQLAELSDRLPARIPTAKPWIAQVLETKGLSRGQIARKLHVSNVTVRRWLNGTGADRLPPDPDQLRLF